MSQAGSIKMSVFPRGGSGTIMIFFFQFLLDHCRFHRIRDNCFIMYCGVSRRRQWHPTPVLLQKIPWMEEPGRLQSMGLLRVGHDWATSLSCFTFMHWRRKWQPISVFLPGESQGRGSLVGCRLWGHTESDTTEETQQQQQWSQCEDHNWCHPVMFQMLMDETT